MADIDNNEDQTHKEYGMEELRAEVIEQQKAILWEDQLERNRPVNEFMWKGNPHAKPVQRAGLIVFACAFLLLAVCFVSIAFEKRFENDASNKVFPLSFAVLLVLVSIRFIRNAFLRSKEPETVTNIYEGD